jgi:class 3 adenylate cyclase
MKAVAAAAPAPVAIPAPVPVPAAVPEPALARANRPVSAASNTAPIVSSRPIAASTSPTAPPISPPREPAAPAPVPRSAPPPAAPPQPAAVSAERPDVDHAPRDFDATVLVCDMPDKYELLDNSEPAAALHAALKFNNRMAELLKKAGAYVHRADGEGVVAIFGYPEPMDEHAEKAVRTAFELTHTFSRNGADGSNGENAPDGLHVGISSGPIIAARPEGQRDLWLLGETLELARRFCLANGVYGSRILIGPQTFEFASHAVVARPIDFLGGVTAQERHEVYEPLTLAADAKPELLARRDSFWNGVVLYREKRWAEAYAAFQQARNGPEDNDPPLDLYLRRLEPLASEPAEASRE